jgi:hypothetical protein
MRTSRIAPRATRRLLAVLVSTTVPLAMSVSCASTQTATQPVRASSAEPGVLWDGSFDDHGVPPGANGPSCGTGDPEGDDRSSDSPDRSARGYGSVEEMGNTQQCTNIVALVREPTRTRDSRLALKVRLDSGEQREQPQSTYSWVPDDRGSVDEWYGFSIRYAPDWKLGGGISEEVSDEYWHNPIAFRMEGDNGSLNLSGDMDLDNGNGEPFKTFSEPHMVLRRNTVMHQEGFYKDGRGLDKLDLGPVVVDRWMDFVCHIRWSTTEMNALRECWRDGTFMGRRTSLNAVAPQKHFLRVGLYQTNSIEHPRTAYYDNVRIGTSYRAVDPSRSR